MNRSLALTCCVLLLAGPAIGAEEVTLEPFPKADGRSMIFSEDGEQLLMNNGHTIRIHSVRSGERLRYVQRMYTRGMLARDGKVFVTDSEKGKIVVYDPAKDWAVEKEIEVGKKDIFGLWAPGREYFDGRTVVCHDKGDVLVNVRTGAVHAFGDRRTKASLGCFSYDAKEFIQQSSMGRLSVIAAKDLHEVRPCCGILNGSRSGYVYQTHPGAFWFAEDRVLVEGAKENKIIGTNRKLGELIVPDARRRLVYALEADRLTAYRLDPWLTRVGSRKISNPDWVDVIFDEKPKPTRTGQPPAETRVPWSFIDEAYGRLLRVPVAETLGDKLYMFIPSARGAKALRVVTEAFPDPSDQPAQFSPGRFEPVHTLDPVTTMVMTPDGQRTAGAGRDQRTERLAGEDDRPGETAGEGHRRHRHRDAGFRLHRRMAAQAGPQGRILRPLACAAAPRQVPAVCSVQGGRL